MFKRIGLALILSTLAYQTYGAQLQATRFFDNSKGLMDHTNPLTIPNQNCTDVNNVSFHVKNKLMKRFGDSITNSTGALTSTATTGGGYYNPSVGANFFGVIVGTNVWRTGNSFGGVYTNVTGTVTLTVSASNLAQTTGLNDRLVFCNESNRPFSLGYTGNAVILGSSSVTDVDLMGAKTCSTYGNYLLMANTTEVSVAYPSRVRWSNINNVNSFPALNYIDVEPNDGDKIVSIITFEDSVYVFKKRSIYRVLITGLDGPDAFIIRPVSRNIGAWAKNSVKILPNIGIAFLAQNTVYILSDNGLDPVGEPILQSFEEVTRNMWANAVAEVYPKTFQYWIAVSTTSDSQNHLVLVYDYSEKAWSHYTGLNVNMMAQAEDSTGANIILTGDYTGNIYKQDTLSTQDNNNGTLINVPFSYSTPDYTMDTPELTKGFKYLYVFFDVFNSSITIEADYDRSGTFDPAVSIGAGGTGALYDTALYDTDSFPQGMAQVARIELNRSARTVKLRFKENSVSEFSIFGWTIVYSLEDFKQ